MKPKDIEERGIVVFNHQTFETIYFALYDQVMDHLIEESTEAVVQSSDFVLHFFDVFENSKKLIEFDVGPKDDHSEK